MGSKAARARSRATKCVTVSHGAGMAFASPRAEVLNTSEQPVLKFVGCCVTLTKPQSLGHLREGVWRHRRQMSHRMKPALRRASWMSGGCEKIRSGGDVYWLHLWAAILRKGHPEPHDILQYITVPIELPTHPPNCTGQL